MQVLLVQYNIIWESPSQNISKISDLLGNYMPNNAFIVLPEMFSTGFTMKPQTMAEKMDGDTVHWMKAIAKQYNSVIAGSLIIEENIQFYNRFVCVFPNGNITFYNKRHLFRMGGENNVYCQGNERLIVSFDGFRILPLICYDLRFPVWSRNQNDYDVIVYSANWPASRQNVWNSLLKARAIENQAYVIGVNRIGTDGTGIEYIGESQVVDFKGFELVNAASKEEIISISLNIEELNTFKKSFPTWMDGDGFSIL
jgi:omega-amidase